MKLQLAEAIAEVAIAFSMKGKNCILDPFFAKLFTFELAGEEVRPFIENLGGGEVLTEYQKFVANKHEAQAVTTMLLAHQKFLVDQSPESLVLLQKTEVESFAKKRLSEDPIYLERAKRALLLVARRKRSNSRDWRDEDSPTGYVLMMLNLELTITIVSRTDPKKGVGSLFRGVIRHT